MMGALAKLRYPDPAYGRLRTLSGFRVKVAYGPWYVHISISRVTAVSESPGPEYRRRKAEFHTDTATDLMIVF
jgi:hypothetical protein